MHKVIIIPDSFKGTISSIEAAKTMEKAILDINPKINTLTYPIADGGEGTVDCFLNKKNTEKINIKTINQYGEEITAYCCKDKDTFIIEVASACGITLSNQLKPHIASTYGVGLLIKEIIKYNPKKIIIGLGGSGTNDGGVGMASALGTIFYDLNDEVFIPTPLTLTNIKRIDNTKTKELLKDIKIIAMCDVTNPLCGTNGASYVFGPQKGADPTMVKLLDNNLYHLGTIIEKDLKVKVLNELGTGAAGGLGAAVKAFLNGNLQSGINTLLDIIDFQNIIKDCNYIFTGEGKFDSQSINGKVISGISSYAKEHNIPIIVLCGILDLKEEFYKDKIYKVYEISNNIEEAKKHCKENIYHTMQKIINDLKIS